MEQIPKFPRASLVLEVVVEEGEAGLRNARLRSRPNAFHAAKVLPRALNTSENLHRETAVAAA